MGAAPSEFFKNCCSPFQIQIEQSKEIEKVKVAVARSTQTQEKQKIMIWDILIRDEKKLPCVLWTVSSRRDLTAGSLKMKLWNTEFVMDMSWLFRFKLTIE